MQNFIVLGYIPGTNIQTTFNFWIGFVVALLLLLNRHQLAAMARALGQLLSPSNVKRIVVSSDWQTV